MKKDYCAKCGKFGIIETHHILPLSTFGKNKELINLCPNCHKEYHEHLGKDIKNPSMEFHLEKFFRWIFGLSIIGLLLYLLF
jgi:predicted HNH restriction endonuclease